LRNCRRSVWIRQASCSPRVRLAAIAFVGTALALAVGASEARPSRSDQVTISVLAGNTAQPVFNVLIPNFERVYPNITVSVTYAPTLILQQQLETTELAAGNAPDVLDADLGCDNVIGVCPLAKAGYLAPLVNAWWTKWELPQVISLSKYGKALYAFDPIIAFNGLFTNDDMFKRLRLAVPQTIPQLLAVCAKAKAAGTIPVLLAASSIGHLLTDLALTSVYRGDPLWNAELQAGKATFEGTPGWHQALQEFVDMNSAGCFDPGAAATTSAAADVEFAQGQALMYFTQTNHKGTIDAGNPQFAYSQHPFPNADDPTRSATFSVPGMWSINAHASPQNQAAARTFIDFMARTKQDALYARLDGAVTQYELLKGELPSYLSSFAATVIRINPAIVWQNAAIGIALDTDSVGMLTGQTTIDDVLNAMDAASKQGP
jgi:raffinose/stachyose/melibiose transport system substrate-binding protein